MPVVGGSRAPVTEGAQLILADRVPKRQARSPLQFRRKPAGHPGAGVAQNGDFFLALASWCARTGGGWPILRYATAATRPDARTDWRAPTIFGSFPEGPAADLSRQTRFRSRDRNDRAIGRLRRHIDLVAAHPNRQGKNGGEWRFSEGQKRHFSLAGAKAPKHKPLTWLLLCQPTFLAPEGEKNVGRHFRARSLSTRPRGRVVMGKPFMRSMQEMPRISLERPTHSAGLGGRIESLTNVGQRRDATFIRFTSAFLGESAKRLVLFEQAVDEVGIVRLYRDELEFRYPSNCDDYRRLLAVLCIAFKIRFRLVQVDHFHGRDSR